MKSKYEDRARVKTDTLCVLLSQDEKKKLRVLSDMFGISMSSYARMVLLKHMNGGEK